MTRPDRKNVIEQEIIDEILDQVVLRPEPTRRPWEIGSEQGTHITWEAVVENELATLDITGLEWIPSWVKGRRRCGDMNVVLVAQLNLTACQERLLAAYDIEIERIE